MAGAFSGHLIDRHHPNTPFNSSIASHGAMSFNPMMHGTPLAQQSFSLFGSQFGFNNPNDSISEDTAKKIASLQAKLNQKLGPEYISQRPGPGGGPKLTYVEGWKVINLANEVFGFNGWSSSIISLTTDFADYSEETRRYCVGVTALIRVTLRDGVFHEDIGYGMLENAKSKGAALDKCKKEAVTDGLKRALRSFGNVLGNCLYDKSYTQEIVKVKFEPVKLNKDGLHRRPEFEDVKLDISALSASTSSSTSSNVPPPRLAYPNQPAHSTPTRPHMHQNPAKPLTSLPPHMRSEAQSFNSTTKSSNNLIDTKGKVPGYQQPPTGLKISVTTPVHPPPQPHSNHRVSFSIPAPEVSNHPADVVPAKEVDNDDDSFGFTSDDDAFLALADLGPPIGNDADIGRPIKVDGDRPIDQDEGLLRRPDEDDDNDVPPANHSGQSSNTKPILPSRSDPNATKSRQELIAAALGGSRRSNNITNNTTNAPHPKPATAAPGAAAGMLSKLLPLQGRPNAMASGSSSGAMRPPPPPQNPNPNPHPSLAQQNHQRYLNQRAQNQNLNPVQQNKSVAPGDAATRPPTPSIGGFNFPLGVAPPQTGANASSSSVHGVKRSADVMSSSSFRGGRPGMGLQQAAAGTGKREVLGSLEVLDGGDVKRARWG